MVSWTWAGPAARASMTWVAIPDAKVVLSLLDVSAEEEDSACSV